MADAQEGRPIGRRGLLTEKVIGDITRAIAAGAFFKDACRHAGVHEATAYRWLELAEADEPVARPDERPPDLKKRVDRWRLACEFRDATEKAQADAKVAALARIQKAGRGGDGRAPIWQADAWWLERTYPDEYGRRRVEVTGGPQGSDPVRVSIDRDSIEQLLADPAKVMAAQAAALGPAGEALLR